MSRVRANQLTDKGGAGAPSLPYGINVTGVTTTTTINATTGTFTGNVSVGGTLTYDDVTNIDSVGLITARNGLLVSGVSTYLGSIQGINVITGVATFQALTGTTGTFSSTVSGTTGTFTSGVVVSGAGVTISATELDVGVKANFSGPLSENVNITAGKLSDNTDINIDKGMIHLFTTQETTTSTPNITSNAGINTDLAVGDSLTVSVITTAAAGGYSAQWKIDGTAVTEAWNGGSAPSSGGSSGKDYYTINIIKTGSAAYTVLGNVANFA